MIVSVRQRQRGAVLLERADRHEQQRPAVGLARQAGAAAEGSSLSRRPTASGLSSQALAGRVRSSVSGTGAFRTVPVCEWSCEAPGRSRSPASAGSLLPFTHSGSGPSSGRPVKNLAAMQPPRQESYAEHWVQAPPVCGLRRSANSVAVLPHLVEAARRSRTLPARNCSWIANGQA